MIKQWLIRWAMARQPDFIIGGADDPYLLRWWLIPRNPIFNIYLHKFLRSDDDRALHDHPWAFNCSWLLDGAYIEWVPGGCNANPHRPEPKFLKAGDWRLRRGPAPHRVQLHVSGGNTIPCWTLFITGPRVREWGFHCPKRWVPWQEFVDTRDAGSVGRGCE